MAHKGRDNSYWKHGLYAGWSDYRHGAEERKPVSLASVSIATKSKPIVRKAQRGQFVSAVMDRLRDWRLSPFENEAAVRCAVRNYFVARHHGWEPADGEAMRLVSEALHLMGAERPSWLEGQWIHTAPRENCLWCQGPIDDEDQARGRRFCSRECARVTLEKRAREGRAHDDMVLKQAHHELAHWRAKPRPCKHCGRDFRNSVADVQFCSRACFHAASVQLADIACADCGKMFRPRQRGVLYCSRSCGTRGGVKRAAARQPEKTCACCFAVFRAVRDNARFCSPRCRVMFCKMGARLRRQEAVPSNVVYLTARIFDGWFKRAA